MTSRDKARVQRDLIQNVETVSSPHTFASSPGSLPQTCTPDVPTISNVVISSAVAGLSADEIPSTKRVQTLTFDMSRISPPIANMFRRILMTEVPTVAFDRVLVEENDGVVLDELLSHRLGLCPIAAPVERLSYVVEPHSITFQKLDASKCIVFELDVTGKPGVPITPVYSGELRWVPLPGQESWQGDVFLVHHDIMLAKLGPNQRIKLRAVALKGLGLVHTKWSPVSSCFYQMSNEIRLAAPVVGAAAESLRKACPMRVFDVEETGVAVVRRPRDCTLCRECMRIDRYPDFAESIRIEKDKTVVHFTIETVGQHAADVVFRLGMQLFGERMRNLAKTLKSTEVKVINGAMA